MPALSAARLISLWEEGSALPPLPRAHAVLAAAWPELTAEDAADLPLGARDRLLLAARAASFGPRLEAQAACRACGGQIELAFDVGQALAVPAGPATVEVEVEGQSLTCRAPAGRDLAAVLAARIDAQATARRLVRRCVDGGGALDDAAVDAVGEALAAADPWSELVLSADCPTCGAAAELTLDPLANLWAEIEARAQGLLAAVARLARAFGWGEAEVLALSETRRRNYLALAGAA